MTQDETSRSVPPVGSAAPDVALPIAAGGERRLSEIWSTTGKGLVLVFLRHFG